MMHTGRQGAAVRALAVLTVALLVSPLSALALELRGGDKPSVGSSESVRTDIYMAGGAVTSAGEVQQDLAAAGGTVLVTGPVWIDLLAAGGTVTVTGDVGDDARLAGGTITIEGSVGGDVAAVGGQLTVAGKGVHGDVAAAGGSISVDASVGGSVRLSGGDVTINAPVAGDLDVRAQKITLGPKAVIGGNFTYKSPEAATMESGAVVKGATSYESTASTTMPAAAAAGIFTLWTLAKLLMLLVASFALYLLAPRFTRDIAEDAGRRPVPNLGVGVIALIVAPVTAVILLATVIALPLGFLVIAAYVASVIFGTILAPIITGAVVYQWIFKQGFVVNWRSILLGIVVYFIIGFVPVVGWILKFAAFLLAYGASLSLDWRITQRR